MTKLSAMIAKNIKNARAQIGWSQSELAYHSDVTSAAISLIEKGDRCPSLPVLFKMANALKVSIYYFIEDNQSLKASEKLYAKFNQISLLDKSDQKLLLDLIDRFLKQ